MPPTGARLSLTGFTIAPRVTLGRAAIPAAPLTASAISKRKTAVNVAPLVRRAAGNDVATHRTRQPPRNRETKSRAAGLPAGGHLALLELLEQLQHHVGRKPDSSILDLDRYSDRAAGRSLTPRQSEMKLDAAVVRELHRIEKQVQNNLTNAHFIAANMIRNILGDR